MISLRQCMYAAGALAALMLLGGCGGDSPMAAGGGSGTNTGNARVSCVIHTRDTGPAANAPVRLRPADYLPALPSGFPDQPPSPRVDTVTARDGSFEIGPVDTGIYTIEIGDSARAVALVCTVTADDRRLRLPDDTLERTGTITGSIPLSAARRYESWVRVYGLERTVRVDAATGRFVLDGMPPGEYELYISTTMPTYAPASRPGVRVAPDSTSAIEPILFEGDDTENYQSWNRTREVYLNTASEGADVAEAVTGFPVCIRLDTAHFDFSQAQRDGGDLRFSRNGGHLAYQIEHWDRAAGTALVWVRVDTIRGHDADQFITMHWGNPQAANLSDGAAVFDTRDGFAGVWHLGHDTRDATANANHGSASVSASGNSGALGEGREFDGVDDFIDCGKGASLAFGGRITISAWVKLANPLIDRYYRILSKKNPWDGPHGYELECNPVHEGGYLTLIGADNQIARAKIGWDSAWHHCVGVFDGNSGRVYRDGAFRSAAWSWLDSMAAGENRFCIGGVGPGNYFDGYIDEVRVSRVARSSAWIRLCQENQNPYRQTLVEFR